MHRRFAITIALSAVFMLAILLLDRDGLLPQLLLGGAVAVFVWISSRGTDVPARQILWCVVVATTGEVVLSIGWGLYSYTHATIPLYVPPGHALFYFLAAYTASQPFLRGKEAMITRAVIVSGSVIAVVSLLQYHDTWGCLWWAGALALIHVSQNQLMLAACFVYTIILEWVGTALGNWRWTPHVPFVGLHSANPPAGVGILYILLDLIVMAICGVTATTTSLSASPSD